MGQIIFVAHGPTEAQMAGRFPVDEPLSEQVRALPIDAGSFAAVRQALCAPERRARETAALLGLAVTIDGRIRDWDYGDWAGKTLREVESAHPVAFAQWATGATTRPAGGESFVHVLERVTAWFDEFGPETPNTIVVTHPAVIRASLCRALELNAPELSFRFDIEPFARVTLTNDGRRWRLRFPR